MSILFILSQKSPIGELIDGSKTTQPGADKFILWTRKVSNCDDYRRTFTLSQASSGLKRALFPFCSTQFLNFKLSILKGILWIHSCVTKFSLRARCGQYGHTSMYVESKKNYVENRAILSLMLCTESTSSSMDQAGINKLLV